jgi:hypothetical protein
MRRISWLFPVAVSAAALLLLATPAGAVRPSQSGGAVRRCGDRFVPAVVGGRRTCLQTQMACSSRWNAAYRRYLFSCSRGYLVYWWRGLLNRPLRLPVLGAGEPCPADVPTGTLVGRAGAYGGPAFGPGPAYPTLSVRDGRAALSYLLGWGGFDGWDGAKVLWTVPRYTGPYIVRGRQLDGAGELRFDQGPSWTNRLHPELRLVGPYADLNPAATFLQAPGCYAYQVDGRGFSYRIVFEAAPAG